MKIVQTLKQSKIKKILKHLSSLETISTLETGLAKDRKHLWLKAEPDYKTKKYKRAYEDDFLWSVIQEIYPKAGLAKICWANGGHGIDWHKDASFAEADAVIINLGKVELQWIKNNSEDYRSLILKGGEVVSFDSKLLHRSIPLEDGRISIIVWRDQIPMSNKNNWIIDS